MKLIEVANSHPPILAWLESGANNKGVNGVVLKYIQPALAHVEVLLANAKSNAERGDAVAQARYDNLIKKKQQIIDRNIKYFTPTLGWWPSADDFHAGRDGDQTHKGQIQAKFPHLVVSKSKKDAITQASRVGII